MALMYGLKVLGIDSSQTNTESAGTRAGKLGKQWEGLIRNAHEGKLDKSCRLKAVKESKERSLADLPKAQNKDEDIPDLSQVFNNENSFGIDLERSQDDSLMDDKKKMEITVSDNFNRNCCVSEKATNSSCSECCPIKTTARSKQHGIDRNEKTKRDMKVQSNELDKNRKLGQGENTTYVAITRYVTPDLHLLELFDTRSTWSSSKNKQTGSSNDRDEALLLSGLHTCGNLASSTLQLFCNSGAAMALCNVGCCYHLLDEQFLTSPFSKQEDTTGDSTMQSGFPMSSYLRQHGCQLGRNARMLASQAPDRLANHRKLPDRSIYWRALLQEILCDITGVQRGDWQARNDWQVGKIASKCHTFTEYVHKALQKLRLTDVEVSDEVIAEYERTHCDQEHKLCAFFQLKAVLAPCIEALILLDRLHYLLEQDNMTATHLVQLFDPVTSPRCYALIALK
ncbi:Methyltransferase-like protein 25 [Lamellibrachia satsuma]|nr:Methyltransferase-like protein 25 [Lamellibrachia satsuma]